MKVNPQTLAEKEAIFEIKTQIDALIDSVDTKVVELLHTIDKMLQSAEREKDAAQVAGIMSGITMVSSACGVAASAAATPLAAGFSGLAFASSAVAMGLEINNYFLARDLVSQLGILIKQVQLLVDGVAAQKQKLTEMLASQPVDAKVVSYLNFDDED